MKRAIVFSVIAMLCCGLLLNAWIKHFNLPSTILNGVIFGSSPHRVISVLGKPKREQENISDTGQLAYFYSTNMYGTDAEVTCYFTSGPIKRLFKVTIVLQHLEHIVLDQLVQDVTQSLVLLYGVEPTGDANEYINNNQELYSFKICTGNGATSIHSNVVVDESCIIINNTYLS